MRLAGWQFWGLGICRLSLGDRDLCLALVAETDVRLEYTSPQAPRAVRDRTLPYGVLASD